MSILEKYLKQFDCVQKRAQACLRTLSIKCVCKSYIYLIYMEKQDLVLKHTMVDKLWKQSKPNHIYLIYMYKEDLALNNL